MRILPSLLLLLLGATAPAPPAAPPRFPLPPPRFATAQEEESPFAAARRLIEEGKADEARAAAERGLARDPYSTEGYRAMMDASALVDDSAGELHWGKWLYWAQHFTGKDEEAEATASHLAEIWPDWNADAPIVAEWVAAARRAAEKATRNRDYRFAGHLTQRLLDYLPNDPKLAKDYERLTARAGEIASGGSFVADKVRRRSPKWIERQNRAHSEWKNAFQRKTAHYLIKTNIGYSFFETVSVVMEEMFRFYQDIYNYHKKAPRVTLAIHRKRADFDRFCHEVLGGSLPSGVLGWFYDHKLTVAAFMDTQDMNVTEDDLWRTMFHEASHEFMFLLTRKAKGKPPTWLNEGTSSYFEGCELKADGSIVKNKPAALRIREWEMIENSEERHSLAEVISYPGPGSYPGSFYSYGWALVYFLLNYEENDIRVHPDAVTGKDEGQDGERVIPAGRLEYRDAYLKYLASYTKKARKGSPDALTRAKKFFVEEIADPEVPDWDAFEARWRKFTQAIVRESKEGPDFADTLQARCRGYLQAEDWERARLAAERADDLRPDDPETYRLLALSNAGAKSVEEAIYWMFRNWEGAYAAGDEEAAAQAEEWLKENGAKDLVANYCLPTRQAFDQIAVEMRKADQAGHPVAAMLFGAHLVRATGILPVSLKDEEQRLAAASGQNLRLWQRAFPEGTVATIKGSIQQQPDDSVLVYTPKTAFHRTVRTRMPNLALLQPPFDLRGRVQIDGKNGGEFLFGMLPNGRPQAALEIDNGAEATLYTITSDFDLKSSFTIYRWDAVSRIEIPPSQDFTVELEVDADGSGRLQVGSRKDRIPLPKAWTPRLLKGGFAVAAGTDTAALFKDVELRPADWFWPVPPPPSEED